MPSNVKELRELLNHYVGLIAALIGLVLIPFMSYVVVQMSSMNSRISVIETRITYINEEKKTFTTIQSNYAEKLEWLMIEMNAKSVSEEHILDRIRTIERFVGLVDAGDIIPSIRINKLP